MTRLTVALAFLLSVVSVAPASLSPRKESFGGDRIVPRAKSADQAVGRAIRSDFAVTDRTEVLLNGIRCKYDEVPGHATIERMEVDADEKTVLKVYFRVRK